MNEIRVANMIKIKRHRKVKFRTCADSSSAKINCIPREETSSPGLSQEVLMRFLFFNSFVEHIADVFDGDAPNEKLH